ncbi:Bug family tripartite tricarboxylate transporter substrate binding protein [Noviherbaspirillum humi]|nr:tripartite tricarboxylate transporter substrate binding protein [Noviherbaspirillum humi]
MRLSLGLAFAATAAVATAQQTFPTKPIRLVVPFPPGGGTDILARVVANKLQSGSGWTVVVENRPGAGGNIGVDVVAKAPADGYNIVMGQTSNLAVNPTLYAKLPYNPLKDLAPVTTIASAPLVLVVSANSPFKTIADIVAAAKAKPSAVTFGSPGNGTVAHLSGELLQRAAGIKLQHIPYKGANQAMTDLVGNQIDLYMSSIPTALAQIKGGKLRAIAVTSTKRVHDLPAVPTVAEAGFKGVEAATWFGFLVPAGTPAPIIQKLNAETNKALKTPEVREKIAAEGAEVLGGTPEEFAALIKSEIARWGVVVKESGAKID